MHHRVVVEVLENALALVSIPEDPGDVFVNPLLQTHQARENEQLPS